MRSESNIPMWKSPIRRQPARGFRASRGHAGPTHEFDQPKENESWPGFSTPAQAVVEGGRVGDGRSADGRLAAPARRASRLAVACPAGWLDLHFLPSCMNP